jgi:tryptophanyl-tRNA synthetase
LFDGRPIKAIEKEFAGKSYVEFKSALAETIVKGLRPLQGKRKELLKNPEKVEKILAEGAEKAGELAAKKLRPVKEKMGLM